jgi:hypothetical protein
MLPIKLKAQYPPGTIIRIIKLLYSIVEAGVYWWVIYYKHHREKLNIITSIYNAYLFITNNKNIVKKKAFSITTLQTNDIYSINTNKFSTKKEHTIKEAEILYKPKDKLPFAFNSIIYITNKDNIFIRQKGQGAKLKLINPTKPDTTQQYIKQQTREAYLASIYQPKAAFNLSATI